MKNLKLYIASLIALYSLSSCEKVIDVNMPDGEKLPYVDAWITNKPGKQTIKFLRAVNYQENKAPEVVAGAQIVLTDVTANKTYDFTFKNGAYEFDAGADAIGVIGHTYKLAINWDGQQFEASDVLTRVTKIDSISVEYRGKEDVEGDEKEGYYAEMHARDLVGGTDYSWIRTYRNGQLNYHVTEMVAIDASFYENVSDGYTFIEPFREGITSGEEPYKKGDVVKVMIRSVSKPTYDFLDQLIDQLYSGGLFAKVLQNVPSNIFNKQADSKKKIYGWFGTVAETESSRAIN
ncbi:DUF4249 family protein [Paraflavitalea sp. CAU 1676]|uniref:DUF4249 family protein n=1 Tax=Paraflavitalea sp. CAU 1676 TaxID=3032598 RepID=UPI0023DAAB0F|nr:DUF4249 family protein [Paraflavitalea sp. CAU 1676]MDF2191117.1 DUF4249 family protein [Paraflavitalea sp. CAU 1676]